MSNAARFGSVATLLLALGAVPLLLSGVETPLAGWALYGSAWEQLHAVKEQSQKLDRYISAMHWREDCKRLVMAALRKQELSFLQAAAWFHRLNHEPADAPFRFSPQDVRSRQELACLEVISRLQPPGSPLLKDRSSPQQMEEQWRELLAQEDPLELPEPPPLPGMPRCPEPED